MYGTTVCLHELVASAIPTATAPDDVRFDIWRSKTHGVMLAMYHEHLGQALVTGAAADLAANASWQDPIEELFTSWTLHASMACVGLSAPDPVYYARFVKAVLQSGTFPTAEAVMTTATDADKVASAAARIVQLVQHLLITDPRGRDGAFTTYEDALTRLRAGLSGLEES